MPKKPAAGGTSKSAAPASPGLPIDIAASTKNSDLKGAGGGARAMGKAAGKRIATATKSAGKMLGKAAVRVGDRNKDGKVDQEDAKIAGAKAKKITAKVADKGRAFGKEAAKHDMVRDAAAGAAIGAVVALPVPVIGPAAGAAIGAIVGVTKNLRSAPMPASEEPGKKPKSSAVKSALGRIRKPRQSAGATPAGKPPRT